MGQARGQRVLVAFAFRFVVGAGIGLAPVVMPRSSRPP